MDISVQTRVAEPRIVQNVSELVGNTPLISLARFLGTPQAQIYGKLEAANPSGSIKDRIAAFLIDDAEQQGLLMPGGTIVEPTSGNTGAAMALVAALRGYKCVLTTPAKTSQEKVAAMRAYGAEVIVAPNVEESDPEHYTRMAARLATEIPGAHMPNQYVNPANPRACELSIGEEIWRQTEGRVTHVVAGLGTGGTACGIARALKARKENVTIVGVDPEGSVYSGDTPKPYAVEGIGRHYFPPTLDLSVIDRIERISDDEAFETARRLAREAGIMVGGSSGAAVAAARRVVRAFTEYDYGVVVLPDSGRSYFSKIFNT